MKRNWHHPAPVETGRRYWRSLSEYKNTPEHQERLGREFDPGLSVMGDEERESSRREFMKIMGGAAALSGLTMVSCRRPVHKIVPFTNHVEWIIPGKALLYATVMPRATGATPLLVTTHEGRPTHLQSNSLHPRGSGLDIFAQGSILELYNPDRVKAVHSHRQIGKDGSADRTWKDFNAALKTWGDQWKANQGEGLALLVSPTTSPSQHDLLASLAKQFPKSKLYTYDPIHRDGYTAAAKALVGEGVQTRPQLGKADVVFSLDCDFIGVESQGDGALRDFMKRRGPDNAKAKMNRLYVLENRYTLTGGISDHRKPIPAALIPQAAALLAQIVGQKVGDNSLVNAGAALANGASEELLKWVTPAAEDLIANKGKALVLAGHRYDAAVQSLVLAINHALGAFDSLIETVKVEQAASGTIAELADALQKKTVKQLFILAESDPAYDTPGFKDALTGSGAEVIYLALRDNLTNHTATWTVPAAHYLEAWGDARSSDGTYAIVQPMIEPLFGGASIIDVLLALQGKKNLDPTYYTGLFEAAKAKDPKAKPANDPSLDLVKETFKKVAGGWDEEKWNNTLRDGFLANSAVKAGATNYNGGSLGALVSKAAPVKAPTQDAFEVVLTPDASVLDGRYYDNPWLQEAPDPVTKQAWDNSAWMHPRTFQDLGLTTDEDDNSMIEVEVEGRKLKIVAIQCPGHSPYSITIPLGYGQEVFSEVGKGSGFNGNVLRASGDQFVLQAAKITKLEETYEMAVTQDNYTMEGRAQVREGTLERYKENEDFAQTEGMDSHIPPNLPLYQGRVGVKSAENPGGFDYENLHQWGMVIDLGKCIGCSACIVACQSENNIPTVGRDQVRRGRVMHWIRMDRYFATTGDFTDRNGLNTPLEELDNPEMVSQPMACQNCESAPCETVCPVNATIHTEEGLNAMAYNRCIGTRYCANNCPYIARRFNWFDYNKRNPLIETKLPIVGNVRNLYAGPFGEKKPQEVLQLQKNPNATVRMRGVMEKCTYCVQRLEEAKIRQRRIAKDDGSKLRIPKDAVKTACQASCPAEAIMFGDLANKESTVNVWKENSRNYQVLKYLGTRPRTSYLARIRNVNPKMPGAGRVVPTGESSLHNI